VISAPSLELLHPLPALYASAGEELPEFEVVASTDLPPAAQQLLVHAGDMTSRLETFFADDMRLRVLQRQHTAELYRREVVLYGEKTGLAVEYGAIQINLAAFEEPLRSEIVEARLPLGGLLNRHGILYRSAPRAFLRVGPCARMSALFGLPASVPLYARSNCLLDAGNHELASIVEILRPV
jgi:chorismate-pyruvate lyase